MRGLSMRRSALYFCLLVLWVLCLLVAEGQAEVLVPKAEVEAAVRDGDCDLTAHDRAFVMGVSVVFAAAVLHVSAATQLPAPLATPPPFEGAPTFGTLVADPSDGEISRNDSVTRGQRQ